MLNLDLIPVSTANMDAEQLERMEVQNTFDHIYLMSVLLHKISEVVKDYMAPGIQNVAYNATVYARSLAEHANSFSGTNRQRFISAQIGRIDASYAAIRCILVFKTEPVDVEFLKTLTITADKFEASREILVKMNLA